MTSAFPHLERLLRSGSQEAGDGGPLEGDGARQSEPMSAETETAAAASPPLSAAAGPPGPGPASGASLGGPRRFSQPEHIRSAQLR